MITMEEILRRLKMTIYLSGKSGEELELAAEIEPGDLALILSGEKKLNMLTLALLCEAMDVSFDAVMPNYLLRDVLEALCEKQGISLESQWDGPARNFELIERLGIGHILKLGKE